MTSEPIHDAESVPKLYGNPGMLGFFTHAQAVSTRLSFFESLGTRLIVHVHRFEPAVYTVHKSSKNICIKMLKDVGMTVPKIRETSAVVYMQQDRR